MRATLGKVEGKNARRAICRGYTDVPGVLRGETHPGNLKKREATAFSELYRAPKRKITSWIANRGASLSPFVLGLRISRTQDYFPFHAFRRNVSAVILGQVGVRFRLLPCQFCSSPHVKHYSETGAALGPCRIERLLQDPPFFESNHNLLELVAFMDSAKANSHSTDGVFKCRRSENGCNVLAVLISAIQGFLG